MAIQLIRAHGRFTRHKNGRGGKKAVHVYTFRQRSYAGIVLLA